MTGSCPDSAFHEIITAVGIVLSMIISGVTITHGGGTGANEESLLRLLRSDSSAEEPGHEGQARAQHRRADTRSVGTCATRTPAR